MEAGRVHLELQPLQLGQYRQVAEWEFGPQENADWERYVAEMNAPKWMHFGIYDGASFVGAVSFEKTSRNMAAYHVVTARRKVNPYALADALLTSAGYLFSRGFTAVTAEIPTDKRAAARLAIRCHMKEWGSTQAEWVRDPMRLFILTRQSFERI
jgi:hypothetical protein